uniref:Uncharacterized protein n=1 Tax=Moniliophthora roreri TaxID=221103 RepID=A0A0W0FQ86_MONRR
MPIEDQEMADISRNLVNVQIMLRNSPHKALNAIIVSWSQYFQQKN